MAIALLQLLLAAIVMVINQHFFTSGFRALWHRAPNMDSLVSLGSAAAFVYSVCVLFDMIPSPHGAAHGLHDLYFESAAMILALITVGKMLEARAKGKTPLFFAHGERFVGLLAAADTPKPESREAIEELRAMGIRTVMLTGDNERTARAIGRAAGIEEVIAGVLPAGKEETVRHLMAEGRVAMVGDGINDAPALTRASVGIAIGAGADVAIDAADVVLVKNRLRDVPAAVRLGRATLRNIHENLFFAFCYNIVGIPLAAGLFIPLLGWQLAPMFGAAAMSLSSFLVVSNALRLNLFRPYDPAVFNKNKSKKEINKAWKRSLR